MYVINQPGGVGEGWALWGRNHILKSVSRKVGCVLTSNEVHFVSLAGNFTGMMSHLVHM